MNRSRCKHKHLKLPSRKNILAMKSMKNKSSSLSDSITMKDKDKFINDEKELVE